MEHFWYDTPARCPCDRRGETTVNELDVKRPSIFKILSWKQTLVGVLCCLLFLGMLLLNLRELMQLGTENSYRNCQNSYLMAASELGEYLNLADNAIESASRRIEEMRAGGASSADILAYMVRETGSLDSRIAGPTTGVYGYIGGDYLDGTGWTPTEGYDPTQRPWYIGAMLANGNVTHVPPFDNLQTGSTTITVCKVLSDGVSVVAMDFPTDNLQKIVQKLAGTETYYSDGVSPYAFSQLFVMDAGGIVIVHSDATQQLKNYTVSDNPTEREIARKIIDEGQTYFKLESDSNSLVYCGGKLDNDWYVFSGLEYGEVVGRIMRNLYISIAAAVIGIAGIICVMASLSVKQYRSIEAKHYAEEIEKENQRLSEKAEAAVKIAELTKSVTALLDNMPGVTSSKDVETGRYLACNQAFAEFAGRKDPEDVIGLTDRDLFDAATVANFAADDKKALSLDRPYIFYEDVADAAGEQRRFQSTKLKFTDAGGRLCTLCMRMDYTELMRVKQETAEAKEAYERAQNASNMYSQIAHALSASYEHLYYVDTETGDFIDYSKNEETGEPLEREGTDFFGMNKERLGKAIHPEDWEEFNRLNTRENILRSLDEHGEFLMTYRILKDGIYVYAYTRASRLQEDDGHIMVGVGLNENIEVRSELTGLAMGAKLYVRGRELLRTNSEGWCIVAVDLEHFKLFNEWYGRESGDELLAQIGKRLAQTEMETDGLACYLGNDDFALLIPYDEEMVKNLYNDIHGLVMERGTSVGFMPAFGVCMTDAENNIEELLDRAAQASHHAKENYHDRIRIFEESMYEKTERDYQILSDFQTALRDHELFIQLQPQCEIAGGKVVGAESLVRWRKADGTMVSPGVFVPVLEQYGFVTDLDQFVWEEVCAWQKRWIDAGHTPLPVSVNVSQIDIFTIDVPAHFELLRWKYQLPVDVIKIEITESAYVGDDAVVDTVRRLREKGYLVLMDDFGSGYSSLNMLRNLNVDIIKLDAQFLRMNSDDRKGVHILESIVGMARSLEAPIIVEGVETQEETEFIKSLGCRYVQGYFFYKPMSVPDFEGLIGDEGSIDTSGFIL